MSLRPLSLSLFVWFVTAAAVANAQTHIVPEGSRADLPDLSIERIHEHVAYLGDDALAGRAPGTPGGDAAADYLAQALHRIGLKPLGEHGTFFQPVPMRGSLPLPQSRFRIVDGDTTVHLRLHDDYVFLRHGPETRLDEPVPLVFVGYGITAPEYGYDDYADIDVNGAIVVFLSGEPPSEDAAFFEGARPTLHALPETKHRTALLHGARGSILVPSPQDPEFRRWDDVKRLCSFEQATLADEVAGHFSVMLRPQRARFLFRAAPYTLDEIYAMKAADRMRRFPLNIRADFTGFFRERAFFSSNIIGMLEGRDPVLKDTYLLVTAHYDHLGIGQPADGDSIYNGVVDNALGCAGVLEIARAMTALPAPARSIVFMFVTGTEKGRLGARHYCRHPAVPLHKTIAAINVDRLAVLDTFDDVIGVGAEFSTLNEHLEAVARELDLAVSPVPWICHGADPFARADQIVFARAGIPAIQLMEGIHYRHLSTALSLQRFTDWPSIRYHSPFDDLHQWIDDQAVLQHCRLILALADRLANAVPPPQWREQAVFMNARLQTIAERR